MSWHAPILLAVVAGVSAGALIGTVHFRVLKGQVDALASGTGSLPRLLALQAARLSLSAGALALVAVVLGAWGLIAAGAGLLVARAVAVRREARP